MTSQNYINHVGLVLDASSSMDHLRDSTVKIADTQVAYLANRSKDLDQETRATVYTFNTKIECVYYDKDVLRLPSIRQHYRPTGMTALIDAVLKAIDDLKKTATLYGDHAFLLYVLTDGQENSSYQRPSRLKSVLSELPDNWTVAVFVPDQRGVKEATSFGFAPGNIEVWDTSERGMQIVGETIKRTTDAYMDARSRGITSTKGLFTLGTENLTIQNVQGLLTELPRGEYELYYVGGLVVWQIKDFVEDRTGRPYRKGSSFYQLTKPETIQASKQVVLRDLSGKTYMGSNARQLLGLPDYDVKVSPVDHPNYTIFVQSTSVNRKLVPGTEVIVIAP